MKKWLDALNSGKVLPMILDTDTYNEIDDQYALAYAMRSSERVRLLAVTAAPFFNSRSTSPADGMEKSYAEARKVMKMVDPDTKIPVYRGSTTYLPSKTVPVASEAAEAIVRIVKSSPEPVYIVAIGAITNVASAILLDPAIKENAVVVWLGGHELTYKDTREFNLRQDVAAAQVVLDSGIPFIHMPCNLICQAFRTSIPEVTYHLAGKNALCDYFIETWHKENKLNRKVYSRVIWDVTAVGILIQPQSFDMVEIPRPIVTDNATWSFDAARPAYLYVRQILKRDDIYEDLFDKLASIGH